MEARQQSSGQNAASGISSRPRWSVAVMCYNEGVTLRPMVERTLKTLRQHGEPFEILIVEDGSKDDSGKVADELAATESEVRVLHHPVNTGIASVLIDGYGQTKGDAVAILPADLQFAPEDLIAAMKAMENADVVNISRETRNDPAFRKLISFVDRSLVWILFGLRIADLHWVKLYRRELLNKMTIQSRTPLIDTELLIKSHRLKARILEIPLPHYPRTAGKSSGGKLSLLIKTFIDLIKLRFTLRI